ncbi:hypothetical protein ACFRI7_01675 [Streptomyces sp. NPDC056716]
MTATEFGRGAADAVRPGRSDLLMPRLTQCRVVDFGKVKSTSCR